MLSNIFIIFRKEIKEILRDRKTLFFMILFPTIVVPLLLNAMTNFMARTRAKARTEVLSYAIFGADQLPELANAFSSNKEFTRVDLPTESAIKDAIANHAIRFAIVIPANAERDLSDGKQVRIDLLFDNASVTSRARQRAENVVFGFGKTCISKRLARLGVTDIEEQRRLMDPIMLNETGTAEVRQVMGERVGGFLPYMFILFCFLGSMYPAIDLGAGEKERGTLETLLLAPVPRASLVLGKFLVVFACGVTSALLSLSSLGVWLLYRSTTGVQDQGQGTSPAFQASKEILAAFGVGEFLLIGAMLIPIAAIFASVLLSISIYARSFREASAYCGPLNFLCILPAFIALLPGVSLTWGWAMVPITNVSLTLKELLKGTMNYPMMIVVLSSSFLMAGLLLLFCAKWFQRESVLFRA